MSSAKSYTSHFESSFKCQMIAGSLQRTSGGPKGRQAERHTYRNPSTSFLLVIVASGIARGRIRTMLPNN